MAHALSEVPRLPLVANTGHVGERIKERREKLRMDRKVLAARAQIDRGQLADIEDGKVQRPRTVTIGAIEDALDAAEAQDLEEMSGPYDPRPSPNLVTFRISGNFGVSATVQGPVDDIDRLEASAARLLRQAMERDADSSE